MGVADLCTDLVRLRSENPPGETQEVAEYIHAYLAEIGIESSVVSRDGRRCNLITRHPRPHLLLCGHLDVVPALADGWRHPPFSGAEEDGCIWGRGSSDMKGGCAALLTALRRAVDAGMEPPVEVVFVCDEETGGCYGIEYLLAKKMLRPCDTLIAEPTPPLSPCIGQKGLARVSLSFSGEPGHSSLYPAIGKSAVMEAHEVVEYLKMLHGREYPVSTEMETIISRSSKVLENLFGLQGLDHVLSRVMFNPGVVRGGEKANIVAEHCDLDLDLRIPWGCTASEIVSEIADQAPSAAMQVTAVSDPSCTSPTARVTERVCAEIRRVYGEDPVPIFQWAASDARHLRMAGFPAVEYGPGEVTTIHGVNERVRIDSLICAEEIFYGIISEYSRS
ncbi:succinyl-diaminopimelate desuccinylase [Methanofollis sp. W23]|uniref:M20/M25/M40 family metallo-hydrolase n=1 Tax=Methanofollis sp. W23 TaxID=2817849 RepID=UPI001AE76AA2|nr:M20/M25/M40 family metallo-hydrolase [Methanofollis sp. W23]MBP2145214.1 succinyl-diaminopimelate desuccinylase [Methanofollis sp. W23]